ncbi:cold-shock protein [Chloroflexota bacterium]
MPKGTIRRLIDRGFGFIKTEQGEDLFFHRSELQGVDYNSLREGQEVEFEVGRGRDGRSQAEKVRLAATESSQSESEATALEDVGAPASEPEAEETKQEDQD